MTKRNIITPADAIARARITPRDSPRPHGRASMDGWMEWQLIDRQGRAVRGGQQHNLLLNHGLDAMADPSSISLGRVWTSMFTSFATHFIVGTGSAEPDPTDGSMDNELARFTTQIATGTTFPSDGVADLMIERELDFGSGNGNLTEWGVARSISEQPMVRELFRDEFGDPVTITKTSEFKLRIKWTLRVSVLPITPTAGSFIMDGIGTLNGEYLWIINGWLRILGCAMTGNWHSSAGGAGIYAPGAPGVFGATVWPWSYSSTAGNSMNGIANTRTPSVYTGGSYTRHTNLGWGTANGNVPDPITGFAAVVAASTSTAAARPLGWVWGIESDDRFSKDDLHIMSVDEFCKVSWDRA